MLQDPFGHPCLLSISIAVKPHSSLPSCRIMGSAAPSNGSRASVITSPVPCSGSHASVITKASCGSHAAGVIATTASCGPHATGVMANVCGPHASRLICTIPLSRSYPCAPHALLMSMAMATTSTSGAMELPLSARWVIPSGGRVCTGGSGGSQGVKGPLGACSSRSSKTTTPHSGTSWDCLVGCDGVAEFISLPSIFWISSGRHFGFSASNRKVNYLGSCWFVRIDWIRIPVNIYRWWIAGAIGQLRCTSSSSRLQA
uniref:Uncharacterized protein n=1 Tax=Opuntia streptacantha TaxID=393608 RepID=A0A7C9AXD6_OPUST